VNHSIELYSGQCEQLLQCRAAILGQHSSVAMVHAVKSCIPNVAILTIGDTPFEDCVTHPSQMELGPMLLQLAHAVGDRLYDEQTLYDDSTI
jgi:hypothetical protein